MAYTWTLSKTSWWAYSNNNFTIKRNNVAVWYSNQCTQQRYYHTTLLGKYYCEIKVEDAINPNYVGFAVGKSFFAPSPVPYVNPAGVFGSDADQWGYRADGSLVTGGVYTSGYGSAVSVGDTVGIACEFPPPIATPAKVWFSVNGVWQGGGNPAAGTSPAFSGIYGLLYPQVCCGYYVGAKFTFISDYPSMSYNVPSGFTDWDGNSPPLWTDKAIDAPILTSFDIAIAQQVYEESIAFGVLADFDASRYKLQEDSFSADVLLGSGVDPAIERQAFMNLPLKTKLEVPDWFDYSNWYMEQKDRSTLKYFLTLREDINSGGEDVPMIGFTMTIRGDGYSFVTANLSYQSIDSILQNTKYMEISFVYYIEGEEDLRVKLFDGEIERINFQQYKTISLTSWFRFHRKESGQNFSVKKTGIRKQDGIYHIKIIDPDPFMRPGDSITDEENDTYPIEVINLSYGPGYFTSEISSNG
jgi:hypothetical protein